MQQIKEFFKEIDGSEVINWRGAFSPLFTLFRWNDENYYKNVYRVTPISPVILLIKDRETDYLFNNDYYESYATEILERYLNDDKEIEEINRENNVIAEKIKTRYLNLITSDLTKFSDTQLSLEANNFNEMLAELVARTVYVEKFDENTLHRVLKNESHQMIDRIWEKATNPHFENFETRRLKILLQAVEEGRETAKRVARFIFTDYFEIQNDIFIERKIEEIFVNREELRLEVEKIAEKLDKNQQDFELWLNTLTAREKIMARYIQLIMQIRDWRKDPIAQAQAVFSSIATELFSRAKINASHVAYVTPHELTFGVEWLKNNENDIIKRVNGVLFSLNNGRYFVTLVDHKKAQKEIENALGSHEATDGIIGKIGARGFAQGRVKIVMNMAEEKKFLDGDVLVTGMTRPEFVPLMKKATAIITDEGGITCHAAIVSRELKKPCIIGTKNASKILHDGDLVEVDADKGVVRIVEKAQ
jgi:phosphohistidine swiveling domain-containing protein